MTNSYYIEIDYTMTNSYHIEIDYTMTNSYPVADLEGGGGRPGRAPP